MGAVAGGMLVGAGADNKERGSGETMVEAEAAERSGDVFTEGGVVDGLPTMVGNDGTVDIG